MRIAIFADMFYPEINGVAISIRNTISCLNKKNKFLVFAPTYPHIWHELKYKNVKISRQFSFPLPSYGTVRLATPNILNIRKDLIKFKPDVIHIHGPGPLGLLGVYFAKRNKIPLVGTYNGIMADFLTYVSLYRLTKFDLLKEKLKNNFPRLFQLVGKRKKELKYMDKEKLPQRIIWQLLNIFYNNCNLVIVPTRAIADELKRRNIKTKLATVSYGINLKRFKPKKFYSARPRRLIHVGRLGYEKNIDVIIRSLPKIIKRYPDIILDIYGDGPARMYLQNLTKELGIVKYVNFNGFLPHEKLNSAYSSHDIFVTASTIETLGLVVLESMASGLPVVCVRKYALPELVKNGKNGYVVAPFNSNQLANAVLKFLSSPKLCTKMGKASAALARKHSLPLASKELENKYRKLI